MIKVLLADDHKIFREGLTALLEEDAGVDVVGLADDGRSAIKLAREKRPHVVVMDVSMPDLNGIEATRNIKKENKMVQVLALSMHNDQTFINEMFKAGASGYLLKDCASDELVRAIHYVHEGKTYISPSIAGLLVDDYLKRDEEKSSVFYRLTDREREVLQLMTEGNSMKEIADMLSVSVKTVHTHRQNIMEKLDMHSTAELTKYAIKQGVTSLD